MALALGALAGGTLFTLYWRLVREADRNIGTEAGELTGFLPGKLPEEIAWELDPHMGWTAFDERGRMLRKDAIITEAAARPALGAEGIVATGNLWNGWRVRAFPAGPNRTFVVGYEIVIVHNALADLVVAYAWSLPLVVLVVVAGVWWATGRALAPFRALAEGIEGVQWDRLDRRVEESRAKDEIQRLAASFNALLARLEKSFSQTRRFAADASHELRTPLTIMRGEVEQILRQPQLPPAALSKLVSLQDEIARLDRITEQLLQLARFDAGQVVLESKALGFSELLAGICEDAELLATAAGITFEVKLSPGVRIKGDELHLRRLVLNLLDNACKYNRPAGRVRCELKEEAGEAVLNVANTGPGIPAELHERIFERFFRADASRPHTRGHGLGLALCWEIVALHGGTMGLTDQCSESWTEFSVRLPVAWSDRPAPSMPVS
ncbi:MAG: HAMP domain-containing protein [Opitutaceae bacterium]|nr:HAMP domain-containing protein [Opitutaceae bacterium]